MQNLFPIMPPNNMVFRDLYFDFQLGLRFSCLSNKYKIVMIDDFSGSQILSEYTERGSMIVSPILYYVDWRFKVFDRNTDQLLFQYKMDLKNKEVLFNAAKIAIGDSIAFMTSINDFQIKHQCKLYLLIQNKEIIQLFQKQYPNIIFLNQFKQKTYYAIYSLTVGSIYNPHSSPFDSKFIGLLACGYTMLGLDKNDQKPKIALNKKRIVKDKYVCIATQASGYMKMWNNSHGWIDVVKFLKSIGYKVLQIDQEAKLIEGCQNCIGDYTLQERAEILKDADFFIGMSSGMAWVSWLCNIDVVMLCNLTYPGNQFYTPYRVTAYNCCYGCWHNINNIPRLDGTKQVFQCKFKGTQRQCQCSKKITSLQVINTIKKLLSKKSMLNK